MRKLSLIARVKKFDANNRVKYAFKRVVTKQRGKPVNPREPELATCYYFRYSENGKQVMEPAGESFADAVRVLRSREVTFEWEARGLDAPAVADDSRVTIADAAAQFIKNQSTLDKSSNTVYVYTRAVKAFRDACSKTYLDQITKQDVLDHIAHLRETLPKRVNGQQNGTIRARLSYLSVFFREYKIENPLPKSQWPKVEERDVEAFTTEEVNTLLSKATDDEKDLIQFFLFTGFRDNEAAHTFYSDVDFKRGTINISNKPSLGFTIKNKKQRKTDITLPAVFVERLRARQGTQDAETLIFPNSNGAPDSALLYRVRKAAKRAGYTKTFGCHKFRKTFGTMYGERVGIVNAQHLLGHADIRTTQKYLAKTTVTPEVVEDIFSGVGK